MFMNVLFGRWPGIELVYSTGVLSLPWSSKGGSHARRPGVLKAGSIPIAARRLSGRVHRSGWRRPLRDGASSSYTNNA